MSLLFADPIYQNNKGAAMRYILLVFLALPIQAFSCDGCACGAANYYLGMMPQFHRSFVGVRFRNSFFDTNGHYSSSKEVFQTIEWWGRYYLQPRWQVLAFLPYQMNRQQSSGFDDVTISGMGDASLMVNFDMLGQKDSDTAIKHVIWAGLGVKAPTGRYNTDLTADGTRFTPNFQLGTGSWDALLNIQYTLRMPKWGIVLDAAGRLSADNKSDYRFGNRVSGALNGFWIMQAAPWMGLMPWMGAYVDWAAKDLRNGLFVSASGGYVLAAHCGFDLHLGDNWVLQVNGMLPVSQALQEGTTLSRGRFGMGVTRMF
jgi:hypothetical protein